MDPGQHFIKVEPNAQSLGNGLQEVGKFVAENSSEINSKVGIKNSSGTLWKMQSSTAWMETAGCKFQHRVETNFAINIQCVI